MLVRAFANSNFKFKVSITTKTGDKGETSVKGKRVDKDDALLEAIGVLDELQSIIQLVNYAMPAGRQELRIEELNKITIDLYGMMGEVAYNKKITNYELRITNLEIEINKIEKELRPINKFITFKSIDANRLNWVRTVCRRAERRVVSLSKHIKIDQEILIYLNRLSDYLFLLSRQLDK